MMIPTLLNWQKMAGLIPVIIQHHETGEVLMQAFMDYEALEKTCRTGLITFYSRSKKRLWTKGETSGNALALVNIFPDCDDDALLITARPMGPVCHTGAASCFSKYLQNDHQFIQKLEEIIEQRKQAKPECSYTADLFAQGVNKICQKVGEESAELLVASLSENDQRLCEEAADLFFHILVLLQAKGLKFQDVVEVLKQRCKA